MTEPTLDDVRAHCELNAGMFEAQAEALRAKVGGGAGEVQAFNAAIYRLALAALDDAERWRVVRLDGSVHAQSFTAELHNTMTRAQQSIHVVAGPVAGSYADMWADHLRGTARKDADAR